ncbi:MAG: carboxypeptidase regulatory-like domain-containing protein [Phycisphaerales bacterium]
MPPDAPRSVVWIPKPQGHGPVRALQDQPLEIRGGQFRPGIMAVTVGTRITFRNHDRAQWTIRGKGDGISFERRIARDQSVSPVTFDRPGTVTLRMAESDAVVGTIVVVDTPFFTVTDPGGQFQIVGIPPGERKVQIRIPAGKILEESVSLRAGRELTVDWQAPHP